MFHLPYDDLWPSGAAAARKDFNNVIIMLHYRNRVIKICNVVYIKINFALTVAFKLDLHIL